MGHTRRSGEYQDPTSVTHVTNKRVLRGHTPVHLSLETIQYNHNENMTDNKTSNFMNNKHDGYAFSTLLGYDYSAS